MMNKLNDELESFDTATVSRSEHPTKSQLPLVLVVEDHEDIRRICADLLRSEGFRVATACDGRAACHQALRLRPALILMDIALPRLDGVSVVRALKQNTRTASIPVIAMTAYDADRSRESAISVGCDAFLSKPFDSAELLNEVHRLVALES